MKYLILLMVVGVALAGRGGGGGGRKKTWYGPVSSETECAASTRSAAVVFKNEDIATTLCRDVKSLLNFSLKVFLTIISEFTVEKSLTVSKPHLLL